MDSVGCSWWIITDPFKQILNMLFPFKVVNVGTDLFFPFLLTFKNQHICIKKPQFIGQIKPKPNNVNCMTVLSGKCQSTLLCVLVFNYFHM